jgi:hypothetical protein
MLQMMLQMQDHQASTLQSSLSDAQRGQALLKSCILRQVDLDASAAGPPIVMSGDLECIHTTAAQPHYKEDVLTALLTPALTVVCTRFSNAVLANSEHIKWIHTGSDMKIHFQAPDLFLCHRSAFEARDMPQASDSSSISAVAAAALRGPDFLFGACRWELCDAVLCTLEVKQQVSLAVNIGEIYPKMQNLIKGSQRQTQRCCLLDSRRAYLLEFSYSGLNSCVDFALDAAGSLDALAAFIGCVKPPWWCTLLDGLCMSLSVELRSSDSFLGRGATGMAFAVRARSDHDTWHALKISKAREHVQSVELECAQLSRICRLLESVPDSARSAFGVVKRFLPSSCSELCRFRFDVSVEELFSLGVGFMFGPVGVSIWREPRSVGLLAELLSALAALHRAGITHGDARLPNIVRYGEQLVWIDFQQSFVEPYDASVSGAGSLSLVGIEQAQLDHWHMMRSFFCSNSLLPTADFNAATRTLSVKYYGELVVLGGAARDYAKLAFKELARFSQV